MPRLIRLKYLTDTNRWTSLTGPALLADSELSRSLLWRDLLADIASMAFTDRFGCWGFLDLWRSGTACG